MVVNAMCIVTANLHTYVYIHYCRYVYLLLSGGRGASESVECVERRRIGVFGGFVCMHACMHVCTFVRVRRHWPRVQLMGWIARQGSVTVCGTRITDSTPDTELAALRLNRLGFVFQTFNLISGMTALENVEMPLTLHGALSAAERRERCAGILRSVGMGDRMHHMPSQLSGGEQQRVTIARYCGRTLHAAARACAAQTRPALGGPLPKLKSCLVVAGPWQTFPTCFFSTSPRATWTRKTRRRS